MKRAAHRGCFSRIGLAAMLLLLVLPTAGRMLQASATDAPAGIGLQEAREPVAAGAGHGHHAHHGHAAGEGQRKAPRPGREDRPECDYCPLLASLAAVAQPGFTLSPGDTAPAPLPARVAPRLPWFHPSGLGSRGPPLHG